MLHKPVLLKETLDLLQLRPGDTAVDGTLGSGGHAREILNRIAPGGRLIGLDQDPEALKRCRTTLKDHPISFHHSNFENIPDVLDSLNIPAVNAVLLDIGFSSDQLEDAGRGFSFDRSGPLDMRMNPEDEITAAMMLNSAAMRDLERIFRSFGEERWAARIAKAICFERQISRIETTEQLKDIIVNAVPRSRPQPGRGRRIHPATRVFQALRIAVNRELERLEAALPKIWERILCGGRFAVISFHSLEDRIVKNQYRAWTRAGEANIVTKRPLIAGDEEVELNSRARCAKLRVVEKAA